MKTNANENDYLKRMCQVRDNQAARDHFWAWLDQSPTKVTKCHLSFIHIRGGNKTKSKKQRQL